MNHHRALALFIGGAGDKKSYYLAGPYRNICCAQEPFDQRIAQAGLAAACRSLSSAITKYAASQPSAGW